MHDTWATGLATHAGITRDGKLIVNCPHCGDQHKHPIVSAGSRAVAAGCHAGPTRLREYAIPEMANPRA